MILGIVLDQVARVLYSNETRATGGERRPAVGFSVISGHSVNPNLRIRDSK
jgi:hypothetical protein